MFGFEKCMDLRVEDRRKESSGDGGEVRRGENASTQPPNAGTGDGGLG